MMLIGEFGYTNTSWLSGTWRSALFRYKRRGMIPILTLTHDTSMHLAGISKTIAPPKRSRCGDEDIRPELKG